EKCKNRMFIAEDQRMAESEYPLLLRLALYSKSQITPLNELRLDPPLYDHFAQLTHQCCAAARDCCQRTLLPSNQRPQKKSRKMCGDTAWVRRPGTTSEWTDYSGCTMVQQLHSSHQKIIKLKPLRHQPMFIVHRHLLTSFVLSGLFYLFNCFFYIVDGAPGDTLIFANHISCRLLFLIQLRFLRLATFSWMLAEGVHLYRLLVSDSGDSENLTIYKLLCWGVPAVIAVVYGVLRESLDNEGCWVSPSVNVVLMSRILYILVKKLQHDPHLERMQYK
ncbi:hypothetical protein TELCIR_12047, partial [Teladorsagia circumcincta]